MTNTPTAIRAHHDQGVLEVEWNGVRTYRFPYFFLRCECPCAACVNEFTGERILDPTGVPRNIHPAAIEFAGNYALKIQWSDGHNTGLYSWDHLEKLRDAPDVERGPE
ncbi:MAG: DUF971 domain-containing protein [Planctomycetaceae bacterium]|nr:DUF971 domain-containing protein [Planctomycetaceae bacterium]